jgi:5-methylcytosine-specific restriction protein B
MEVYMLKELSALKATAIQNIQDNFDAKLLLNSEISSLIFSEFKNYYPDSSSDLIGSTIRFNNNDATPQSAYLPMQWFLRIHQCKDFIEALKEYVPHLNLLKEHLGNDNVFKELPKIEWATTLDQSTVTKINTFINQNFANQDERNLFSAFLDGRSWLDEKVKNGVEGLAGRSLFRRPDEYIGSAVAAVTRLINDTSGKLSLFIDLYISSSIVRNTVSHLMAGGNLNDVKCVSTGVNVIYYGAPGTGKSHSINESINEDYAVRTVFHADTQNSDFLGCLKPKMNGETIGYNFRSGPFTDAIIKSYQNPNVQHWLVIEEINRAPAAAVFGEIFQLLDREPTGQSTYSINLSDQDMIQHIERETGKILDKGMLKIPSNLSLLATMNSSDQAVMPLDTAFKRRWNFRYIPLDFDNSYTENGKACSDGFLHIQDQTSIDEDPQEKQISWKEFAVAINQILTDNGIPEDKHLGPFFLSDNELTPENRTESLTGKLFMYLWDDVLRHGMSDLVFNSEINTYGQLTRDYQNKKPVFSDFFYSLVHTKLSPTEENSPVIENNNENE